MTTLEDIIPNDKTLDALYKLMITNNQNNYVLGQVLFVVDPFKPSNSGLYVCDFIGLMKYKDETFINIGVEQHGDWERVVCDDNKYEVLDWNQKT